MPRDDDDTLPLFVAGVALVTGAVAWALWPKHAAASALPPRSYAPHDSPNAPSEAPVSHATMPAFLAAAPPAGAARERYFESAVDAPTWVPVILSPQVKVMVAADVLKAQGIRIPLWPTTAQRIADRFGAMLPTKKLVDVIYRNADVRLAPQSVQPHGTVTRNSLAAIAEYDAMINRNIAGRGGLIANAKKDVITGRTPSEKAVGPDPRVTIYGWIRSNGTALQDVAWVHAITYLDASHGIRLVSRTAYLNGVPTPIESLFADPRYAPLLNESGTLTPAQLAYPRS